MKILIAVESHFKEYGGPYTAINQKIGYLNNRKIKNKIIYCKTNRYNFDVDLNYIINDFDLVHIYGIWRPFLIKVFLIAKKLKKKIILSPIGALEPWSLRQKKFKKKFAWHIYQKKILNKVDLIHATSEIEAKNISNKLIKTNIRIIGHGIDLIKDFSLKIKKHKIKKIIFFSRIHNKKGIIELIDAWSNIRDKKEWTLEIYGPVSDKYYYANIKKKIKDLNLEKSVICLEPTFSSFDKEKIFKSADGFILPSKSENFGISIGESLSYGLPVLTTFETPWEKINKYNAGYVFNFSNEEIQKNLEKFMKLSDEQRYDMGLNGLKLIKENFLSEDIFKKYENMYKDLLNENFINN